jgi:hypothetical protein
MDFIAAPLWQTRLLKEVDITQAPYTNHYPELIGFMQPQPGAVRDNIARRNLLVRCGELKSGRWDTNCANYVTSADPGFVNDAAHDFRLKPDAAVFAWIPGFKPLPVEKMGLYPVQVGVRQDAAGKH